MQYLRKNLILSGWVCFIIGTGIFFSGLNEILVIIAVTVSLSGILLILVGIGSKEQGLAREDISNWKPSKSDLADEEDIIFEKKRIKYRIDTTLDDPIKTSVLCGNCSELTIISNFRPDYFKCPKCNLELWNEEE